MAVPGEIFEKLLKGIYPFGTNLYQKLPILGPVSPHFESHNSEIWHEGMDLGLPPLCQIL